MALGLGAKGWSVDQCLDSFEGLCQLAFTKRKGHDILLVGKFVESFHHAKYRTQTLEKAFQHAFSDNLLLFGGQREGDESTRPLLKTAVTATSLMDSDARTYVLSNYSRPHEKVEKGKYLPIFHHPRLHALVPFTASNPPERAQC